MTTAWAFATAAWGRPGVEAICLELQDLNGQCPALLFWRLWMLMGGREAGPDILDKALHATRNWEDEVLSPLRAIRRRLGDPSELTPPEVALRRKVMDAELEAEHALLDGLEALATHRLADPTPPLPALIALAQAWRPPAPAAALGRLIKAL